MLKKIQEYTPVDITILTQSEIAAKQPCRLPAPPHGNGTTIKQKQRICFYTTDSEADFNNHAAVFFWKTNCFKHVDIG